MGNEEFLCKLTAEFWKYYLLEPTEEHFENIYSYFSDQLVLIGTGKHEFFTNLHQILDSLQKNRVEAEVINFDVLDEWYESLMVSLDIYLVYGGIWVRQKDEISNTALIDMDTRFSMIYQKNADGWKLVHLHHSIPNMEQQSGEYYPKTLSQKAKDAIILAKMFEQKAEMDLMTGVYNNESFKMHVSEQMGSCTQGNMYLFDLDHFKDVNDTYGHMTGDELLKLFSRLLKKNFDQNVLIGRMGGDEFAVFEYVLPDKELTVHKILAMQKEFENATREILLQNTSGFSAGIATMTAGQLYSELFSRADNALYRAKQIGRRTYYWGEE